MQLMRIIAKINCGTIKDVLALRKTRQERIKTGMLKRVLQSAGGFSHQASFPGSESLNHRFYSE